MKKNHIQKIIFTILLIVTSMILMFSLFISTPKGINLYNSNTNNITISEKSAISENGINNIYLNSDASHLYLNDSVLKGVKPTPDDKINVINISNNKELTKTYNTHLESISIGDSTTYTYIMIAVGIVIAILVILIITLLVIKYKKKAKAVEVIGKPKTKVSNGKHVANITRSSKNNRTVANSNRPTRNRPTNTKQSSGAERTKA